MRERAVFVERRCLGQGAEGGIGLCNQGMNDIPPANKPVLLSLKLHRPGYLKACVRKYRIWMEPHG